MGIELAATIIAITVGMATILQKVGNVYSEIKQSRFQLEFIHKDLIELKDSDRDISHRLNNVETYLAKNTGFEIH